MHACKQRSEWKDCCGAAAGAGASEGGAEAGEAARKAQDPCGEGAAANAPVRCTAESDVEPPHEQEYQTAADVCMLDCSGCFLSMVCAVLDGHAQS